MGNDDLRDTHETVMWPYDFLYGNRDDNIAIHPYNPDYIGVCYRMSGIRI